MFNIFPQTQIPSNFGARGLLCNAVTRTQSGAYLLTVLLLCLFQMNYYIGLNINTMHSYSIHEPFIIYWCMKVIRSSLLLEKMCRSKLNYTSEMCDTLAENPDIQDEVQRHVSDYEAVYRSICVVPK